MTLQDKALRFLLINPFGIGDCLFTTPVISAINETYPQGFIGYWCNRRVEELLKAQPGIKKTFGLSRGDLKSKPFFKRINSARKLFCALKKERFDVAMDFSLDHRYALVCKLAGIKKRVGFDYKGRGKLLTQKLDLPGFMDKHVAQYHLQLLELVGIRAQDAHLKLVVPQQTQDKIEGMLSQWGLKKSDLLVGFACGGGVSWGKDAVRKFWPAQGFAELAGQLQRNFSAKILLLGDQLDAPVAAKISALTEEKLFDLTGKLSLGELAAAIKRLNLLVANDAGPLHMAVALGIKTISFFGPTDSGVYGPYPPDAARHIVLKSRLDCSPCYRNFRLSDCVRPGACLAQIHPQEALAAAKVLL